LRTVFFAFAERCCNAGWHTIHADREFTMAGFTVHPLTTLGRLQEPDVDHLLARVQASSLLLINLLPGHYPFETHAGCEYVLCLKGHLVLESDSGEIAEALGGEMIEVAAGVSHRFGVDVDAVILTVSQTAAAV
jgi:hypothetical protein